MLCTCHNGDKVIESFLCKIEKCTKLICELASCWHDLTNTQIFETLEKVKRKLCKFKKILSVHEKLTFNRDVTEKIEKQDRKLQRDKLKK
jgi:hypothetical protein